MITDYDKITAKHYSLFRPNLHKSILDKCIPRETRYTNGLDIGCGTGQSSLALAEFCNKVIGIEPSEEMLQESIANSKIEYQHYDGNTLEFENDYFDVITFAGSLFYAKSQKLLNEVIRVSTPRAKIIVYDFEVPLEGTLKELQIYQNGKGRGKYNFEENFSGLLNEHLKLLKTEKETIHIEITPSNLTHLLLACRSSYNTLGIKYGYEKLFEKTKNNLDYIFSGKNHMNRTKLYYTIYECLK